MALAKVKIPAGFKVADAGSDGGFGEWHDFKKHKILTGKVLGINKWTQEVKEGKKTITKKRMTMTVETKNGSAAVSDSHALRGLFTTKGIVGKTVYIQFLGQEKIKGGKKYNRFACAVKS